MRQCLGEELENLRRVLLLGLLVTGNKIRVFAAHDRNSLGERQEKVCQLFYNAVKMHTNDFPTESWRDSTPNLPTSLQQSIL